MRLDRTTDSDGRGKYALLKLRRLRELQGALTDEGKKQIVEAFDLLEATGILDWGNVGSESEFFVIKLRDKNASHGLHGYAAAALRDDLEYANEVTALALRSGANHPNCKQPD